MHTQIYMYFFSTQSPTHSIFTSEQVLHSLLILKIIYAHCSIFRKYIYNFFKKNHTTTDINITQNSVPAGNCWLFCFLLVHETHPQTLLIETANDPCKDFKMTFRKPRGRGRTPFLPGVLGNLHSQRQRESPISTWGSGLFLLTDHKESSFSANRCEGWYGEFTIMSAVLKHSLKGLEADTWSPENRRTQTGHTEYLYIRHSDSHFLLESTILNCAPYKFILL